MKRHEEGLSPGEWLLLIPAAVSLPASTLAGLLFLGVFVAYVFYRSNPDAAGLPALPESWSRQLTRPLQLLSQLDRADDQVVERAPQADHPADDQADDQVVKQLLQQPGDGQVGAPTSAEQPAVMPWKSWRMIVQRAPHLLVVGQTGSGKTTLVRGLLATYRGQLIILDPKDAPGKWGMSAVGLDEEAEYTNIEATCQALLKEVKRRLRAMNAGDEIGPDLLIVCDEFGDVVDECPTAPVLFRRVGKIGRELGIKLIALTHSATVKELGITGDGGARDNYTWIHVGKRAVRLVPALAGVDRPGVLEHQGELHVIDLSPLPTYARLPVQAVPALGGLLPGTDPDRPALADTGIDTGTDRYRPVQTAQYRHDEGDTGIDTGITQAQILAWIDGGLTKNEVARRIGGSKTKAYALIDSAMGGS